MSRFVHLTSDGEQQVEFELANGELKVAGQSYPCEGKFVELFGRRVPFWVHRDKSNVSVWLDGEVYSFNQHDPRQRGSASQTVASSGSVTAQMPGKVLSISVSPGETVSKGQNLLLMESMKMELALDAPFDGQVVSVSVTTGQMVSQGENLVTIEPVDEA